MDTMPPIIISPVLREAVELKVEELDEAKQGFNRRYHLDVRRSTEPNLVKRLKVLVDDINKLDPELYKDDEFEIISRYIGQAADDRTVSEAKLLKFEQQIWSKLDNHRNRLEVSSLHAELMKEAIDAGDSAVTITSKLETTEPDDDFEVVENELDEVLERFEKETFISEDVDVEAIDTYLSSLFVVSQDKSSLEYIREDLQEFSEVLLTDGMDIDQDLLMWCITDLLKSDLVGEEKKRTLEGYLQSPVVLRELMATISAKSIRHWDYKDADKGLPVTARQNAEGQYCIAVEEGLIDLLFLHAMGIGWAIKLKRCLMNFARNCQSFINKGPTSEELNKREYFLGRKPADPPIVPVPVPVNPARCSVCHPYFPPAPMPPPQIINVPPPPPPQVMGIESHRKSKSKQKTKSWWPPFSSCPPPMLNVNLIRKNTYIKEFFMSRLPVQEGCTPDLTALEDVQAKLIKTMAVEAKLREALDDEVEAGCVHFDSLASSLPHKTILTVLKFLGIPETFLDFFERFLSAKLNIGPAVRGAPDRVLPRTRGVPEGHALELFFTEAIMFFLELAVHQDTGNYLYRIRDRAYYVEPFEAENACGSHVDEFASIMGLTATFALEQEIGLVGITPSGLILDDDKILSYARGIKKRLGSCTSVLEWVRIWNSTAGTYAAHLFGPLAEVFGKSHLDTVKNAYNTIFDIVLDGRDLTSYITHLLSTHLARPLTNPPFSIDALIYLPQAYGGLGVLNPFITMHLAHDLPADPSAPITTYLATEETYYQRAASNFALLPHDACTRKLETIYANDAARIAASLGADRDPTRFCSKEELFAHRENWRLPTLPSPPGPPVYPRAAVPCLATLYEKLLREPVDDVAYAEAVRDEVRRLAGKGDMKAWHRLAEEDKWVLQLYGDECFETYGGLEIWCGEFVPLEILKAVRGSWDESDDGGSSVSDMTEP